MYVLVCAVGGPYNTLKSMCLLSIKASSMHVCRHVHTKRFECCVRSVDL